MKALTKAMQQVLQQVLQAGRQVFSRLGLTDAGSVVDGNAIAQPRHHRTPWASGLVALVLVVSLALGGCAGNAANGVSGNYGQDTLDLVQSLRAAIALPDNTPEKRAAESESRSRITSFFSYYRRDNQVESLPSFRTIRTALNSIAGHYSSYPNRPLPEKLKSRVEAEFKQVEVALRREA